MKKQISSVVKLKDGEKVILGGLINTKKGEEVTKVPILGNIPLLGYAFQQKRVSEMREELIVIITPHIIKNKSMNGAVSLSDLGYEKIRY
jgi:general secretion pathway protein D